MTSNADAQVWLVRADVYRRLAEQMTHPSTRREVLQLADEYRRLAERAEHQHKRERIKW